MPKTATVIETQEVQSVLFRGFKRLSYMKFAAIRLPDDPETCAKWLASLVVVTNPHTRRDLAAELGPLAVTFGDRPLSGKEEESAICVAFTAAGLSHLGLAECGEDDAMATFPAAFNLGMWSRQRILGDDAKSKPSNWRWSDADRDKPIHVALLVYGKSRSHCDELFDLHRTKLSGAGFAVYELDTQPTEKGVNYEHFGFRDGISQPVIRGTQRFARGAQPRDIMAPGEFLLGYQSNQGYYPPTPMVARESDANNRLGSVPTSSETRFSAFQDPRPQVRDFGRNGSFLAIRQFEQHVDAFHDYARHCAGELRETARLPDLLGGAVTPDWIEAKLMGRWHDGVPLIDRPIGPPPAVHAAEGHPGDAHRGAEPPGEHAHGKRRMRKDTDLDFGVDDPQGLYCPFGAHIRRANPTAAWRRGRLAIDDYQSASSVAARQILSTERERTAVCGPVRGSRTPVRIHPAVVAWRSRLRRAYQRTGSDCVGEAIRCFHAVHDPDLGRFAVATGRRQLCDGSWRRLFLPAEPIRADVPGGIQSAPCPQP